MLSKFEAVRAGGVLALASGIIFNDVGTGGALICAGSSFNIIGAEGLVICTW
jgi:hypothetical protein